MHSTARDVSLVANDQSRQQSTAARREGVGLPTSTTERARGLRRSTSTRRPVSWAVSAARELYEGRYHRPAGTRIRNATVLSTATGNPGRYLDREI
jgi:hypothetical protein